MATGRHNKKYPGQAGQSQREDKLSPGPSARHAALTVLERCRRADAWSDAVIGGVCNAEGLDARDRALTAELSYGVIQNRTLLDYCIHLVSSIPMSKIEPKVLDLLRISAYQLLFLKRIPVSAAVNEGVKLCRAMGYSRASGFVNAVLRKLSQLSELPEIPGDALQRLSVRYSHPQWLVSELLSLLGEDEAEALMQQNNNCDSFTLRINSLRTNAETLISSLKEDGVIAERYAYMPDDFVVVASPGDLTRTRAFQSGLFFVQDAAAGFAVAAAEPTAGQRILDICAAPGGKSFSAAILSRGRADLTACDLHPNKLRRIRESAQRLGLVEQILTVCSDGRNNRPEWNARFDLVLADVPCSGLGVIRKKPDIRWKDKAAFEALPALQQAVLENAGRYVKPGGVLLYSTCTFRREENEAVVSEFLADNPYFAPQDFSSPWGDRSKRGMLQLWTTRQGTDCFFISKLRKTT